MRAAMLLLCSSASGSSLFAQRNTLSEHKMLLVVTLEIQQSNILQVFCHHFRSSVLITVFPFTEENDNRAGLLQQPCGPLLVVPTFPPPLPPPIRFVLRLLRTATLKKL